MKTKKAFCAIEQLDKDHEVTIDQNGEYLFRCDCGAFFKLPADFTKEQIAAHLKEYKEANEGQLSQAAIEAENEEKLKNI